MQIYKKLLASLSPQDCYTFQSLEWQTSSSAIILRHDVDKLPQNSLEFAKLQNETGIKGTYYFRIVPRSFNPEIITKIAQLGHEIGYHYEDIDLVYRKRKKSKSGRFVDLSRTLPDELLDDAIESFEKNLAKLRKYYDVKTICMHGSPLSPFDNKLLWSKYDYHDFGIIAEPYFDVDFNEFAYYTDTGRKWDGDDVSVRDRVMIKDKRKMKNEEDVRSKKEEVRSGKENESNKHSAVSFQPQTPSTDTREPKQLNSSTTKRLNNSTPKRLNDSPTKHSVTSSPRHLVTPFPKYHTTEEIINAINNGTFPKKAMLTFHPQRWTNNPVAWTKELVLQNAKNVVKKYFFVKT